MYNIFLTGQLDLAMILTIGFTLFFVGLVIYLRREDRREGYPLEDDVTGRLEPSSGLAFTAPTKTFLRANGDKLTFPNGSRDSRDLKAKRSARAPGSPLNPVGDPLQAGIGPGSYAHRAKVPDMTFHGDAKIVPLRVATGFSIDKKDVSPVGMKVVGADGVSPGIVSDAWVDRAEYMIRYLEIALSGSEKKVLVPLPLALINKSKKVVEVKAILGSQFAGAPGIADPNQITFDEEERVAAYFGGGLLYATPGRSEPYL